MSSGMKKKIKKNLKKNAKDIKNHYRAIGKNYYMQCHILTCNISFPETQPVAEKIQKIG